MNDVERRIEEANRKVMDSFLNGQPVWVDVQPALQVVPGMKENRILVAGPPIEYESRVTPAKRSICGAIVHEGLAGNLQDAEKLIVSGEIEIVPAQDCNCACGSVTAVGASTPMIVCHDIYNDTYGYASIHPGQIPHVLRWGFYDEETERNLCWLRDELGPATGEAIRRLGGMDIKAMLSKTAGMGDENHSHQYAVSMAAAMRLIPVFMELGYGEKIVREYCTNERWFLHVAMAGCCSVLAACKDVPYSTVMVGMGGNGTTFGLQFGGTGKTWFTAPAPKILGQFLDSRYTQEDLCGYLGDSCVTEAYGLGGFSVVAAPAFMRLTGISHEEAKRRTELARRVSLGEHHFAPIPWDNDRGFPAGIDMRRVVAYNTVPISNGGGTLLGGGQGTVGAAPLPMECFEQALIEFFKRVGQKV